MIKTKNIFLKSLISCHKGEMNLLAIMITMTLTLAAFILIKRMFTVNEVIEKRLQTYSCFHHTIQNLKSTARFFTVSNAAIASAQAAKIVTPSPHWSVLIKATKMGQRVFFLKYYKNSFSNKDCNKWNQAQIIRLFPYRRIGFQLLRDNLGMAILKRKSGSFSLKNISKSPFSLTAQYSFTPSFRLKRTFEKNSLILNKVLSL